MQLRGSAVPSMPNALGSITSPQDKGVEPCWNSPNPSEIANDDTIEKRSNALPKLAFGICMITEILAHDQRVASCCPTMLHSLTTGDYLTVLQNGYKQLPLSLDSFFL